MGRFYVELSITVYADTEDEANNVGEAAVHLIKTAGLEEVGDASVVDVEDDSGSEN